MIKHFNNEAVRACERASRIYPCHPIALYGSHARGDVNSCSDIDVLIVGGDCFHRWNEEKVSFSRYPTALLSMLADTGSLFLLHLKQDAIVYRDPERTLERLMARYRAPRSYGAVRAELRVLLNVLDVGPSEYGEAPAWFNRVGLFLMRTAAFVEAAEKGIPCFSIMRLASTGRDPALLRNYELKYKKVVSFEEFVAVRDYVEAKLAARACNQYGTVLALIAQDSHKSALLRGFGRRFLKGSSCMSDAGVSYSVGCESVHDLIGCTSDVRADSDGL